MSNQPRYTFTPLTPVKTGERAPAFDVVAFTLDEALSTPFHLAVELSSHTPDIDFGHLLDQPVLFTLWQGDHPLRHVHGLVSDFTQQDTGTRRTRYHAVVEPLLARA